MLRSSHFPLSYPNNILIYLFWGFVLFNYQLKDIAQITHYFDVYQISLLLLYISIDTTGVLPVLNSNSIKKQSTFFSQTRL